MKLYISYYIYETFISSWVNDFTIRTNFCATKRLCSALIDLKNTLTHVTGTSVSPKEQLLHPSHGSLLWVLSEVKTSFATTASWSSIINVLLHIYILDSDFKGAKALCGNSNAYHLARTTSCKLSLGWHFLSHIFTSYSLLVQWLQDPLRRPAEMADEVVEESLSLLIQSKNAKLSASGLLQSLFSTVDDSGWSMIPHLLTGNQLLCLCF